MIKQLREEFRGYWVSTLATLPSEVQSPLNPKRVEKIKNSLIDEGVLFEPPLLFADELGDIVLGGRHRIKALHELALQTEQDFFIQCRVTQDRYQRTIYNNQSRTMSAFELALVQAQGRDDYGLVTEGILKTAQLVGLRYERHTSAFTPLIRYRVGVRVFNRLRKVTNPRTGKKLTPHHCYSYAVTYSGVLKEFTHLEGNITREWLDEIAYTIVERAKSDQFN